MPSEQYRNTCKLGEMYYLINKINLKLDMHYIGLSTNSFIWKIHSHSNAECVFLSQIRLVSTYSRNSALLLLQIFFLLRKVFKAYMCTCMLGSNETLSLNKYEKSVSCTLTLHINLSTQKTLGPK